MADNQYLFVSVLPKQKLSQTIYYYNNDYIVNVIFII
jgi:hypothetical protein